MSIYAAAIVSCCCCCCCCYSYCSAPSAAAAPPVSESKMTLHWSRVILRGQKENMSDRQSIVDERHALQASSVAPPADPTFLFRPQGHFVEVLFGGDIFQSSNRVGKFSSPRRINDDFSHVRCCKKTVAGRRLRCRSESCRNFLSGTYSNNVGMKQSSSAHETNFQTPTVFKHPLMRKRC